ncbi:MAG: hypothetical protein V4555_05230 [Acidobacteriota bacterium]
MDELVVIVTPVIVDPLTQAVDPELASKPKPVIPYLVPQKFDNELPKREKK